MSLRPRSITRPLFASLLLATAGLGSAAAQVEPSPSGASVPPISKDDCPASHPVKGNNAGRVEERPLDPIYHVPESRWYAATDPEDCFASAADAEAAGYRAPLR